MGMKAIQEREKTRCSQVSINEKKRLVWKVAGNHGQTDVVVRWWAFFKLASLPRLGQQHQVKRRCLYSNRSKSILRHFRCSRIEFKSRAVANGLNGIQKASW